MSQRLRDLEPERQRALRPVTRARALLELGEDKIALMDRRPRPPDDDKRLAAYDRFRRSIGTVRRLAAREVIYVDGARLGRVVVTSDPRMQAITDLAELASVAEQDLDRRTLELAEVEDRGLVALEAYMATLPEPGPRPSTDRVRRPPTQAERARAWASGNEEAWARIGAMPMAVSLTEQVQWQEALLDG